jgi:large subunit ribosomal protein L28
MSRVCQITGAQTGFGNKLSRRGKAKRYGGVGQKLTGITNRRFKVNLHWRRIWVPELGRHVRVRVSAQGLRTINKKGPYRALLDAGLIKPTPTRPAPSEES